jgi:hypothetical protein
MALPDTDFFKRICAENEKDVPVLTESLVSDCFGIDECKEIAKAARSKKLLGLKLSTRSLRYLPSIGLETILPTFEESTVENLLGDALVAMVQPTDFGKRDDSAHRLHGSRVGRIFIQREMKAGPMVITEVRT